jgi:nucleoside phosphorylase
MEAEARPLVTALGLLRDDNAGDPVLPFQHFRGTHAGLELLLSVAGKDPRHRVDNIGTDPAALCAYVALREFRPELCINAGTAGGFAARGGRIGDVYLGRPPYRFHDRRIAIPGFDRYGEGHYPGIDPTELAARIGLKTGVVSTGNSLDHAPRDLEIMAGFGCDVKEMEAAAIAWVASLLEIPFLAVKSVTDLVDGEHPTQAQFLANLAMASQKLSEAVRALLAALAAAK